MQNSANNQASVDRMQTTACETCRGIGLTTGKRTCRYCGGLGIVGVWNGIKLRWGHGFNARSVLAWEIEQAFFWLINIVLIGFVVWGVLAMILTIAQTGLSYMILWDFWTQVELVPFWFSILAECFLFYRLVVHKTGRISLHDVQLAVEKHRGTDFVVADVVSKEVWHVFKKLWRSTDSTSPREFQPIHLFAALLQSTTARNIIVRLGLDSNRLHQVVQTVIARSPQKESRFAEAIPLSAELKTILLESFTVATQQQLEFIEVQTLLLTLVRESDVVAEVFVEVGASDEAVEDVIQWFTIDANMLSRYKRFRRFATLRPKSNLDRAMTATATPVLDQFSQDITQLARLGHLNFCVGRDKEIEELFRMLEGGTQGIALVGPDGVGKSTIIHSVAEKMITEEVPDVLKDKRLVALSIPKLLAGATSSGIVEQRMLTLRDEIIRSKNIVLFVDDIHDLVGAGGHGDEGLDTSELVARVIERNDFPVLATTNPIDWRRFIEGKSLGNVLQRVSVDEPDAAAALAILQAKVASMEHRFVVFYSYASLIKTIELSERYLHDQVLPEKAIRIMEEVAVHVKNHKGEKSLITGEDVAELISQKIDIPVTQITQDESEKLLHLEDIIHRRLVNQEEAVQAVASALRRARTQLRDEERPIVNLLFLGPTGVGKTELAKTVAAVYFGNDHEIVRLDMSEYQNKDSVSRLIGSQSDPTGGYLTQGIKQQPYTVLLLDELEKAHPDILDIFLQVMDDGRLTDWSGQTINFTSTIIIATSNAGTGYIQEETRKGTASAVISEALMNDKLKEYFRPEFLNRFDNIVVFKPLTKQHIKQVARLMLEKNKRRLLDKGVELEVTDAALEDLAQQGFDPLFGARPMRRLIQGSVDDAIAKFLLTGTLGRRDTVILDKGGRIKVKKGQVL